ncbi:hypothetical protein [Caballeronia mineralivorans]|uniref:hypothetical protein n=1 Tax=Caballeronia mineralivorans TaxID=2010198 RepID=UPI0023F4DC5A|nr:hypothetical protein [Caballeronia mineralivorans]
MVTNPLAIEHLLYPIQVSQVRLHVTGGEPRLLHPEANRLNCIREIQQEMLRLVTFNYDGQDVQTIAFRRRDLGIRATITEITFKRHPDSPAQYERSNIHNHESGSMASAAIASYSTRVPMNSM